jgi:hypothetical protein
VDKIRSKILEKEEYLPKMQQKLEKLKKEDEDARKKMQYI